MSDDQVAPSKTNNSISSMVENERCLTNGRFGDTSIPDGTEEENAIGDENALIEIGNSRILRKHVKKLIFNATIILKQDCRIDIPDKQTYHQPGVCAMPEGVKVARMNIPQHAPFRDHVWGAFDFYQKKLSDIIGMGGRYSDDCLISILYGLAHAVQYLHGRNKPHGNLAAQFVALSCDNRKQPFILEPTPRNSNATATKSGDIRDLGKLFYFVLTKGKEYCGEVKSDDLLKPERETAKTSKESAETAKSLIKKMVHATPIEIDEVLKHPMFWSDEMKVNFITGLYDTISHQRAAIEDLEDEASKVVFEGDWIEKLGVNPFEKEELATVHRIQRPTLDMFRNKAGWRKTSPKKRVDVSVYVSDGKKLTELIQVKSNRFEQLLSKVENRACDNSTVRGLAEDKFKDKTVNYWVLNGFVVAKKEKDGGYQKESFYDLLRFFRNKKAHYWEESSLQERKYFTAAGGFWTFFSKRFPKLLSFLYDRRNKFDNFAS